MLRKFGFKILTPRSRHGRVHCANSGGERIREKRKNALAMMVLGAFPHVGFDEIRILGEIQPYDPNHALLRNDN